MQQLHARHLRQRQQAFNQLAHLRHAGLNARQVVLNLLALLARIAAQLLGQQTAEAVNRVERRAQIMRHRIRKSLKLLVRQTQGRLNGLDLGDVRVNTHPENHFALFVQHR